MDHLKDIIREFDFEGYFVNGHPIQNGHINDTYKLNFSCEHESRKSYILQKINTSVFRDPLGLMHNIHEVSNYLRPKLEDKERTLQIVRTKNHNLFLDGKNDGCWRAFEFIDNTVSYEKVTSTEQMYKAGLAIAKFHHLLADYPVDNLKITIKDFHNTKWIYDQFMVDLQRDKSGKSAEVFKESSFFEKRQKYFGVYESLKEEGKLPIRICHNDTKFNNILFDKKTEEPVALIDLDTVMPGFVLNDFGDAIRTGANSAAEDEKELDRVQFNLSFYESFTKGYLTKAKNFLCQEELNWLAYSPYIITMEQGIRFLHDHLNGDIYFKTSRKNHNLERARNQIKLAEEMELQLVRMNELVVQYSSSPLRE